MQIYYIFTLTGMFNTWFVVGILRYQKWFDVGIPFVLCFIDILTLFWFRAFFGVFMKNWAIFYKFSGHPGTMYPMEQRALKNVNNYLNCNIYSYLETSGGQSSNLYLNVVHFFNTIVY